MRSYSFCPWALNLCPVSLKRFKLPFLDCSFESGYDWGDDPPASGCLLSFVPTSGVKGVSASFCRWYVPTTKYSPVWKHGSLSRDRGTNSMQLGGRSKVVERTGFTPLLHFWTDILPTGRLIAMGMGSVVKMTRWEKGTDPTDGLRDNEKEDLKGGNLTKVDLEKNVSKK
jgi:hypothetical protein